MRKALDEGERGATPDIPAIAAALGPVVLPSVAGRGASERERIERRRRRG
jgi:hypothetical protein